MRRLSGQAARGLAAVLHHLAHAALGAVVLCGVLLGVAAWRLSQGPVDLSWFAARLQAAADASLGAHLTVGSTALAWEGFRLGVDRPLDLRLTGITLTDPEGRRTIDIPRAEVSVSLGALLLGRVQVRAVELDGARLTLRRDTDGALSLDIGGTAEPAEPAAPVETQAARASGSPLAAVLAALARPPGNDRGAAPGWLSQVQRVRVHDGELTVIDRQLGATWRAPQAEIDLRRQAAGGVNGFADLTLALGEQRARLTATATLSPGATETRLAARLTPVAPAALARIAPALAALAMLDAPVGGEAALTLDPSLALRQVRVTVQAGAGTLKIGDGQMPILDATLVASGTPDAVRIESARVELRGHPGGPVTHLTAGGAVERTATELNAALTLDLDQVDFADLPVLWPKGVGGGARPWITSNITAGSAHDGHVELGIAAAPDLSAVTLTRASGALSGSGLTVSWLRPVPPIVGARAQLRIVDPDTLDIAVQSGRQVVKGSTTGLTLTSAQMHVGGLMQSTQTSEIHADIAGSVADALALLREPRLHLLDKHPMALADPGGTLTGTLVVTLPLEDRVRIDDVVIRATAHLQGARVAGIAAGHDLDQGNLDLTAGNDGMTLKGQALLAGIPAVLDAAMDFRAGPGTQVLQRVAVSARPEAKQLAAAGVDLSDVVSGPVAVQAVLSERRNGSGSVQVDADLAAAALQVSGLEWRKPAGAAATASARVALMKDRLEGIDAITLAGDGVAASGAVSCTDGKITRVRVDRLMLGRTNLHGTVELPAIARAAPIVVTVAGPVLDLSARLARPSEPHAPRPEPPPGPPWTLEANFDRVLMANDYVAEPVSLHAENDGRVYQRLQVDGAGPAKAVFAVRIAPVQGVRHLTLTAARAGELLRGLDWLRPMQEGTLTVTGTYDDTAPGHPLTGNAELVDFRVRQAPILGKLLQAMTLYGVVDAMRGPGLVFRRLVAPFRLTDDALDLIDARAFSSSLGLTVKGRIDLAGQRVDLQGTIVPAYFFNSLLGSVPLVGRLFSPERGGGVFAASYSVRGRLADPDVAVNPLSALTPGFLRGVFGIF